MSTVRLPPVSTLALTIALALSCSLAPHAARADRPLTVDGADTLPRGTAKLEGGWLRDDDLRGLEIAAAYAPWDNLEFEIGYSRGHNPAREPWANQWSRGVAVKWGPLQQDEGLSLGLKYGYERETFDPPGNGRHERGHHHGVQALASWGWASGTFLHVNVGRDWARFDGETEAATTWGVAAETPVADGLDLTVEIYGDSLSRPDRALGVRYELFEDCKLSAAAGRGNDRNFFSVGVAWEF